ncbi:MAG: GFA family protein [Pseudomonadota bacterium]
MSNEQILTGGCRCGAVRYQAREQAMDVAYCHCTDCRGFSGAPVVVWIAYNTNQCEFTGEAPSSYESSPGIEWLFCNKCGTSIAWTAASLRFDDLHITEFLIGTLDDPQAAMPDRHWFAGEQLDWFEVSDDLPRYQQLDGDADPVYHGPRA